MTMANATRITVFVTNYGFDTLMQRGDEPQCKTRIGFSELRGELDGSSIEIELGKNDDTLIVMVDGVEAKLSLQPKGHYFGYVGPKAERIGLAAARKLIAAAQAQRDGRPSRRGRQVLKPDAPDINDQIPF